MAGRSKAKPLTETERLRLQVQELRQTVDRLERVAVHVDHEAVLARLPDPILDYEEDLPERVLAFAAIGMFPREIRAALGITGQQWGLWRTQQQRFYVATSRAKDVAAAHWQTRAREAITAKDWKFPYSQLQTMIKNLQEDDDDVDRGDASALVIFDGSKGRAALNAKAGKLA